jgi:hypothetical protein
MEMLRGEHFVWQKFRTYVEEFLPEAFWQQPDELHPDGYSLPAIEKKNLRQCLRKAYDARSAFAHTGAPFPSHVEIGVSDRVSVRAMMQGVALIASSSFVPPFVWLERLTHLVLREYLLRQVAPDLAKKREQKAKEKATFLELVKGLTTDARESLERLTRLTAQFVGYAIIGPQTPNREWAVDEPSVRTLLSAGLIESDSDSMEGASCIKDREIGEWLGEFFFGARQNPLAENTILPARRMES